MSKVYVPIGGTHKVSDELTIKAVPHLQACGCGGDYIPEDVCGGCIFKDMDDLINHCQNCECLSIERICGKRVIFIADNQASLTDAEITELALKAGFGRSSYTESIVANSPLGGVPVTDELREFARLIQEKLEK